MFLIKYPRSPKKNKSKPIKIKVTPNIKDCICPSPLSKIKKYKNLIIVNKPINIGKIDKVEKNCKGLYNKKVFNIINICFTINSITDLNNLDSLVGRLVSIGISPITRFFSLA